MITPGQVVKFVGAAVRHAADGFARVDDKELGGRLATCALCEHRRKADWVCEKCGCYITVKATWRSETCPLGKWELPMATQDVKAGEAGCGCQK